MHLSALPLSHTEQTGRAHQFAAVFHAAVLLFHGFGIIVRHNWCNEHCEGPGQTQTAILVFTHR